MKKSLLIFSIVISSVVEKSHAQIINTIAGDTAGGCMGNNGYSGDGGQATLAQLDEPYGVAVDKAGNVYIADMFNNVIRKVNTAGIITTVVGTGYMAGTTSGGYNKPSGPATTIELSNPMGVAVDTLGNVYFGDSGNNIVRKLLTTGYLITIAGNATTTNSGHGGYSGDGGPATFAELNGPQYIAVDLQGNVYVNDYENAVIRKINTAGIISTIAGDTTGLWNHSNNAYSGDGGQATLAQFSEPKGLAIDGNGNIYIADLGNQRIRMVNTAGIINTIAGGGSCGTSPYCGDGGQATDAELSNPQDVAVDAVGNLYIADWYNNVIRKVNTSGIISTVAGDGYGVQGFPGWPQYHGGYSGDGGEATNAELNNPNAVALDAVGNIYISDQQNNVIRKVSMGSPTGIAQLNQTASTFAVYPNPSNGQITISLYDKAENIRIIDMQGRTVYEVQNTAAGEFKLDISQYTKGIYFVMAKIGNNIEKQKLVVE